MVALYVCECVKGVFKGFLKGLEEWRSGDGESVNSKHLSPHLSILLFPSAAHESLMLELGCWLISHLCAHSIDRLPADCWAGWDSHWVYAPARAVSLPLFFSLSFCFSISQQHQKCFNRALMASAPNLTSNTHSNTHTHMHVGTHAHTVGWK